MSDDRTTSASENFRVELTVCVIGRNEAKNIERCARSLRRLAGTQIETIYVDSASTDGSAQVAARWFDRVLILEFSQHLNASAARHVGTREARGRWILYLDGDMELAPEIIADIDRLITSGNERQGLAGKTINIYPDGSTSLMLIKGNRDSATAIGFGGAVLLPRNAVIAAGNWNPRLYSNEEMELLGRVRHYCNVIWHDRTLALHHTEKFNKLSFLFSLFIPWKSLLGKKFYGAGQVVSAGIYDGTLKEFLAVKRAPFVYIGLMFTAALAALAGLYWIAAAIALAAVAYATKAGGRNAPITYLSWLPQIATGVWRYPRDYVPRVTELRTQK